MDKIKLSPSEIEKLKNFISEYSSMYKKLEDLLARVESIDKEKKDIDNELRSVRDNIEKIRLSEVDFQENLIAKYGEFHLNVETFEIKPHIK